MHALHFDWDEKKSAKLQRNPKRAFSFEEVSEIFSKPHFVDQRNDDPEQYFAIGWVKDVLVTVIFEYRIFYLVPDWIVNPKEDSFTEIYERLRK